jgi:hypothetical protein
VYRLDAHLLARLGPLSTTLERGNDVPSPALLVAGATQAAASFGLAATLDLLLAHDALSSSPCPPATCHGALHRAAHSALEGPALIVPSHMRSPAIDRTNHSNAWTA